MYVFLQALKHDKLLLIYFYIIEPKAKDFWLILSLDLRYMQSLSLLKSFTKFFIQATVKSRIQNSANLECVSKSRNKDCAKISRFTVYYKLKLIMIMISKLTKNMFEIWEWCSCLSLVKFSWISWIMDIL